MLRKADQRIKACVLFAAWIVGHSFVATGVSAEDNRNAAHPRDLEISMSRSPCFGSCPSYSVHVNGAGSVSYVGKSYVTDIGEHSASVSSAVVDQLVAEFERIQLLSVPAKDIDLCPEGSWTDQPTVSVEFRLEGKKREIIDYHGCRGNKFLDQLRAVEEKIDLLLNTSRWTKLSQLREVEKQRREKQKIEAREHPSVLIQDPKTGKAGTFRLHNGKLEPAQE